MFKWKQNKERQTDSERAVSGRGGWGSKSEANIRHLHQISQFIYVFKHSYCMARHCYCLIVKIDERKVSAREILLLRQFYSFFGISLAFSLCFFTPCSIYSSKSFSVVWKSSRKLSELNLYIIDFSRLIR